MLERLCCGQYAVSREHEVVDGKKTDIRLTSPRCIGPVTIEVNGRGAMVAPAVGAIFVIRVAFR
jgi:hypothetical protein